jgi:hypothetical protein
LKEYKDVDTNHPTEIILKTPKLYALKKVKRIEELPEVPNDILKH